MLQKIKQAIKQAFSWLVQKVRSGVTWVRENRSWLQEQAREMARQTYAVRYGHASPGLG